jgi:DNA adenine methylase
MRCLNNKDYGEVIHQYNNTDTFFFLDPPYENKSTDFGYAEDTDFDFERFATLLRLIKGNYLMTINESPNIRHLFKGVNIRP